MSTFYKLTLSFIVLTNYSRRGYKVNKKLIYKFEFQ